MPMVKATWAKSRYAEFLCVRVADVDACAAQAAVLIGVPQGETMLSTVHDSTTVSIATPMSRPSRCGGILGREIPSPDAT